MRSQDEHDQAGIVLKKTPFRTRSRDAILGRPFGAECVLLFGLYPPRLGVLRKGVAWLAACYVLIFPYPSRLMCGHTLAPELRREKRQPIGPVCVWWPWGSRGQGWDTEKRLEDSRVTKCHAGSGRKSAKRLRS
ncbi:hypothetical protein LY78DRAFT_664756 [Colletotrichum sublineola]|nr:hypothetical protein LY78DRAFT_664756 [Colletotrichum sublineola]